MRNMATNFLLHDKWVKGNFRLLFNIFIENQSLSERFLYNVEIGMLVISCY